MAMRSPADLETVIDGPMSELTFARAVEQWLADEKDYEQRLGLAARYAAWATHTPPGHKRHGHGVLFHMAHKLDLQHLVPVEERRQRHRRSSSCRTATGGIAKASS